MIAYYGMGGEKVRNLSYYNSTGQESFSKPYSEQTALEIDIESKALIDEAYDRAKEILTQNREAVTELATLLLEKEVIFAADLERILGKRKLITRGEQIEMEKAEKAAIEKETAEKAAMQESSIVESMDKA